MAVFRIEKTRDYTVMSNHHLKNKNLSLKAKGLMSLLLSLPDNWVHTMAGLAQISVEGVDALSVFHSPSLLHASLGPQDLFLPARPLYVLSSACFVFFLASSGFSFPFILTSN